MASAPKVPTRDPDHVTEALCDGPFYLHWSGTLGTLVFTHTRPDAGPLFGEDKFRNENIVRARVTLTIENLVALRDLLSEKIKTEPGSAPTPVDTRH